MARTTINIDKAIREELKKCRKYKRETYDETLKQLIKARGKKKKPSKYIRDEYGDKELTIAERRKILGY